jgi:hypothetical protein
MSTLKKSILLLHISLLFITTNMMCNTLFKNIQLNPSDSASVYFKEGLKLDQNNKHFKAYKSLIRAKELYQTKNETDSVALCNLAIFKILRGNEDTLEESIEFLDAYHNYGVSKKDSMKLMTSNYYYASYYFEDSIKTLSPYYYKKSLVYAKGLKRKSSQANIYSNLGLFYTAHKNDSAKYFFEKALKTYPKENTGSLFQAHLNYANFFQKLKDYKRALIQLKKAETYTTDEFSQNLRKIIYKKYSECYSDIGNNSLSLKYLQKHLLIKDSLDFTAQKLAISELNKKYKNAEQEKIILEEQQKSKERRNLLIGAVIFIVLGGAIGLLTLKNSRKKQQLAEQEKALEVQKNLTLLKEQEITTINAMVSGQEKERKRVAEDLHDNLGSVLATLKLHFENLRLNKKKQKVDQDVLFDKTENLIDEAYLKVRSIAHAKNAGVIANEGLLKAVQMMAEKISSANKIAIEVIHFGLDTPLENSLEIAVFRMIQELTTNVLKHANASQSTINISKYENTLNIIVEDNGKGFDISQIDSKTGMGLHSIRTRVEHIQGEFVVDTTPNKGATIIINIPIE